MDTTQADIIQELSVIPTINPELELQDRVTFLTRYLDNTERGGFVLGISGGQDSLLAGYIAQRAVEARRDAGAEAEFHAVLLPYGEQRDRQDAELAIDFIQPDRVHDFQIRPAVDALAQNYQEAAGEPITDYDKGNVKARTRMVAQYAIASRFNLLVIGTDHAAEAVTGFFTKFGDGAADVLPLSGLNKRQGREILRHIGAPEVFTTKKPTADLLDVTPGQADETELGITYDQLDDFLEGKAVPESVAEAIITRFDTTRHKRALPVAFTDMERVER